MKSGETLKPFGKVRAACMSSLAPVGRLAPTSQSPPSSSVEGELLNE